jgi:hypothetical protein
MRSRVLPRRWRLRRSVNLSKLAEGSPSAQFRGLFGCCRFGMWTEQHQTAAEALPKFKAFVDKTDPAILGKMLESLGYTKLGLGLEQARIVKGMSREEVAGLSKSFLTDKTGLGLDDKMAKKWVDFTTQMERAGWQIETVFAKGMVNLTPNLIKLSDSFIGLLDHLLNGKEIPGWIKKVGDGLDEFAKSIGEQSFQQKVSDFARDAGDAVRLVESMLSHSPSFAALVGTGRKASLVFLRTTANNHQSIVGQGPLKRQCFLGGAVIQVSISSLVVKMAGIALGWMAPTGWARLSSAASS